MKSYRRGIIVAGAAIAAALVATAEPPKGDTAAANSKVVVKYPISLTLKRPVPQPVAIAELPPIVYSKGEGPDVKEAAWMIKLDVNEKGAVKEYSVRGAQRIELSAKTGDITAQSGSWFLAFQMFASAYEWTGQGTLRLALFDPAHFDDDESKGRTDIQLSNWVSMPVRLSKE